MNKIISLSLSDFIQENLKKINPERLKEIEITLEKASHLDLNQQIPEIASPLFENFELESGKIKETDYLSIFFFFFSKKDVIFV